MKTPSTDEESAMVVYEEEEEEKNLSYLPHLLLEELHKFLLLLRTDLLSFGGEGTLQIDRYAKGNLWIYSSEEDDVGGEGHG